jgi:hypothetical protein
LPSYWGLTTAEKRGNRLTEIGPAQRHWGRHRGRAIGRINDLAAEVVAVKAYNESIRVCVTAGDDGTKEMLESILGDEEDHVDWLEAQLTQIDQVGREVYLAEQIG